jgi:3D (Asp-Asp-Asp) domain-containing protein
MRVYPLTEMPFYGNLSLLTVKLTRQYQPENLMNQITFSKLLLSGERLALTGLLVAVVIVSLPTKTLAFEEIIPTLPTVLADESVANDTGAAFVVPGYEVIGTLPVAGPMAHVYGAVSLTAYTSRVEECDATPFTTADGSHVRDGIIAANFLKFGTKVRIPALFGDKVFEVHDRMNKRFPNRVDVWMDDLTAARQFGVRHAVIEIVEES